MNATALTELLVKQMKDLYNAEWQMLTALPQMAAAANHPDLKAMFDQQLAETQTHVQRLESAFDLLGRSPLGQACKAVEGMLSEVPESNDDADVSDLADASLLAVVQRIGYHKLAGYDCARGYATILGNENAITVLQDAWDEEFAASHILSDLTERVIALEPDEDMIPAV